MKPTTDQLRSIEEPLMTNRWALYFPKVPLKGYEQTFQGKFNLLCESVEPPKMTNEVQEISIRQFTVNTIGKSKPAGPMSLTFLETIDVSILDFFHTWERTIFNPKTGKTGNKSSGSIISGAAFTSQEAIMTLINLDGNDTPIYGYNVFGCILTEFDPGSLESGVDLVKPTATISFDYFDKIKLGVDNVIDAIDFMVEGVEAVTSVVGDFI